ncbi:hypothetical protein DV735_g1191, partial [Chaetothyriales sp. CBS 134920]
MSSSKPLTFADVLPVTQLSSHEYQITLDGAWTIGTGTYLPAQPSFTLSPLFQALPNGGYTTSAFLICARTHMQLTHPSRSCADPINVHLEFMRRTAVGPATFRVRDVKIGSRISNLHLTLYQDYYNQGASPAGESSSESRTPVVEGYITLSNIATEAGLSLDTSYTPLPPPLPADLERLGSAEGEDDNYMLRRTEAYPSFRAATLCLKMYLVKPDRWPESYPLSINDQWSRFTPWTREGRWTNDGLGFVVDMFPQVVEKYINPIVERASLLEKDDEKLKAILKKHAGNAKYWYPTMTLNLDVKKVLPAEGVDWLFTRTKAKTIKNGRLDLDIEVWDDQGDLVATSHHSSLIVDTSRNTARRSKDTKI